MSGGVTSGWAKPWRIVSARPRLMLAALIGMASYPALFFIQQRLTRGIIAWDIACAAFLVMAATLFSNEPMSRMAADAKRDQEGEWTIFWLTIGGVMASFAAILGEFSETKDLSSTVRGEHIAVVAVTLLLSWLMTHTVFAMRYAHEYYDDPPGPTVTAGGLDFPGEKAPDYWDFFYFALVLGMTFQVSDVQITSRPLRRLAAAHGLLSFLFNTVILALSVNIGASLLG